MHDLVLVFPAVELLLASAILLDLLGRVVHELELREAIRVVIDGAALSARYVRYGPSWFRVLVLVQLPHLLKQDTVLALDFTLPLVNHELRLRVFAQVRHGRALGGISECAMHLKIAVQAIILLLHLARHEVRRHLVNVPIV